MELYKKYRPQNFSEMIGNEAVIASLQSMIETKKLPHTLLFSGQSGTGKTTLARIIAHELGCTDSDVSEMNMSSQELRGIGGVQEITNTLGYKSLSGRPRVIILDECDQMTNDAQKLLKKPLEDTYEHIYFCLCTTRPEKLVRDIITRATQIELELVPVRTLARYLRKIAEQENEQLDTSFAQKIAEKSEGSTRKAMVFLDQVLKVDADKREKLLNSITAEENTEAIDLCRALLKKESWQSIATILKSLKSDAESTRYVVLAYMNSVLLSQGNNRACEVIIRFSTPFYTPAELTCACFELA